MASPSTAAARRPRWTRRGILARAGAALPAPLLAGAHVVGGCGGAGGTTASGGAAPAGAIGGTIEYANNGTGPGLEWEQAVVRRFAEKFPATRPSIVTIGSDYMASLVAMAAAGNPPDVVILNNDLTALYLTRNLLRPLDALLARDKVDRDDFVPIGLRTYRVKDTQAAIPYDLNSVGFFLNRTLFEQAGVPLPTKNYRDPSWTPADVLETARKLTRPGSSPDQPQFGVQIETWIGRWAPILWGNGADVFDDANNPQKFTFISRETEETLQFLADLRQKHKVMPQQGDLRNPPGTSESAGGQTLFRTGRLAMLAEPMSIMPDLDRTAGLRWTTAPVTRGPKGRFTRIAGAGLGIPPGARNPDGAWAFITFHSGVAAWELGKGLKNTLPPTKSAGAVALEGFPVDVKQMWLETLQYGRTQALHLKWALLMEGDGARKFYTQALFGEVSVKDALDAIKRHADAVLT